MKTIQLKYYWVRRVNRSFCRVDIRGRNGRVCAARQVLGARADGGRAARGSARLLRGRRRAARARRAPRVARPRRPAPRYRQADQLSVLLLVSLAVLSALI